MDQIGKYQILDKIGSGGFAVVYKGYDPFIKRPVAIKVCYSRDEETRERFHREAEIAGRLEHRNITRVFDFGFHEQMPYLVEEHLSGEDLAHLIRRGDPETLDEKLDVLIQIASGLEYAHSQGVIHRDVKPSNVRILDNGRVKIMDFGTAKMANVESNLTQTGMTLGTVAYLSPQRLLGQDRGSAPSDIFSYGVLAYELLSGHRPFPGKNIPNLIDQVLNAAAIPLLDNWPECPPRLADVVHQCLEKEVAKRYPTCAVIIRDLEDLRMGYSATQTLPQDSNASGAVFARRELQTLSLLERAKKQLARGRHQRAEFLVEEVLEIDPENEEAKRLLADCQKPPAKEVGESTQTGFVPEDPAARRQRKIVEARSSIESFLAHRELGQAAAALVFAVKMLGQFDEAAELRRKVVETLKNDLAPLKGRGLRQATEIARKMEDLHCRERLSLGLARELGRWAEELDPDVDSVSRIVRELAEKAAVESESRDAESRAKKRAEAIASIEKLLREGNPAMAEKALQFAVRLFGKFDEATALESRIAEARVGEARGQAES